MNAPKIILILMVLLFATQHAGAQSTSGLLDKQVAKDELKAIEDLGALMVDGHLEVDAYVQAVLLVTAGEETESKYEGTYGEAIKIAEKMAVEAGNKQEVVTRSAQIIPTSTELIEESKGSATFKLNFSAKNQLDVPLYGLDVGVNTLLADGTDGYGSTGVEELSSFKNSPIAPGETRKGLFAIIILEYDEDDDPNSIYGMYAVVKNLKTLNVKVWELPIYDCLTKDGWMMYDRDE